MELLLDSILDALHDTWLMLPLLYVVYLFLEYLQRKNDQNDSFFWNLQKYGPLFGALLGLIPQCGFSILAATLYVSRNITLGTMIAVFIATSDEAVPILISEPKLIPSLGLLLVLKFVIAAACGFFIDHVLERHQKIIRFSELADEDELAQEEEDEEAIANSLEEQEAPSCSCCYPQYPLWLSALLRSAKIWLFIFLFSIVMNVITGLIGEENLAAFLQTSEVFQPLFAALFGFIPNCAATVVLCQLFAANALTFGSLLAGLITNAGLGLVALFQYDPNRRQLWKVLVLLLIPALASGYLVQFLELIF